MWPSYVGQGSLIAFSSLSALHNVLATRPLFVRERSNAYYRSARFISRILFHVVLTRSFFFFCADSPTAWLFVRLLFDVVPLRIIPTLVVSTM